MYAYTKRLGGVNKSKSVLRNRKASHLLPSPPVATSTSGRNKCRCDGHRNTHPPHRPHTTPEVSLLVHPVSMQGNKHAKLIDGPNTKSNPLLKPTCSPNWRQPNLATCTRTHTHLVAHYSPLHSSLCPKHVKVHPRDPSGVVLRVASRGVINLQDELRPAQRVDNEAEVVGRPALVRPRLLDEGERRVGWKRSRGEGEAGNGGGGHGTCGGDGGGRA